MTEKVLKEMNKDVFTITKPKEESKKEDKRKSFFHINKDFVRFKAHYFMTIGAAGIVFPFMPIVGRNRIGLSATSLAVILTTQQLITTVSRPVIGYIADYFNKLKLIINILLTIKVITLFLVLAIPPIRKDSNFSQLSSLSNKLGNWTKEFEYIMMTATYSPPNKYTMEEKMNAWNIENGGCIALDCVSLINQTKSVCFQKPSDGMRIDLLTDTELNCSCSFVSPLVRNLTAIVLPYAEKQYFPLESLEPAVLPGAHDNKSALCTIIFTRVQSALLDGPEVSSSSDFVTLEFWYFAFALTTASICTCSLFTLSDTALSESIKKYGGDFGKQRMYGSIGWGIFAAISGILCDITNDYLASWILMALIQMIAIWNISHMDLIKPHFSQNLLSDVGRVLKSLEFAAFELGVFFNGLGAGALWFYLLYFLTSLGASKFLCGLSEYVQCYLGEIPLMFFSGWILEKLGHFNLLSLSLIAYSVRFLWYSYLQNPWYVLPVEITSGITIGTLFPAIASYGKLSAKPGTEATTQSILFTTHGGLGCGVGCIIAGICYDHLGGHQTFFLFSLACFGATALNIVNTFLLKRRNTKELNLPPVSSKT